MFGTFSAIAAGRIFIRDENGSASTDSVVVLGGSIWMAFALVSDISAATLDLTEDINDRLEYANIVANLVGEFGPDSETGSDTDVVDCVGNPGNEKCVGNAGETPNGGDDWGSGSSGSSDGP